MAAARAPCHRATIGNDNYFKFSGAHRFQELFDEPAYNFGFVMGGNDDARHDEKYAPCDYSLKRVGK